MKTDRLVVHILHVFADMDLLTGSKNVFARDAWALRPHFDLASGCLRQNTLDMEKEENVQYHRNNQ